MIRTLFGGICDDSLECIRWFYLRQVEADKKQESRSEFESLNAHEEE